MGYGLGKSLLYKRLLLTSGHDTILPTQTRVKEEQMIRRVLGSAILLVLSVGPLFAQGIPTPTP